MQSGLVSLRCFSHAKLDSLKHRTRRHSGMMVDSIVRAGLQGMSAVAFLLQPPCIQVTSGRTGGSKVPISAEFTGPQIDFVLDEHQFYVPAYCVEDNPCLLIFIFRYETNIHCHAYTKRLQKKTSVPCPYFPNRLHSNVQGVSALGSARLRFAFRQHCP